MEMDFNKFYDKSSGRFKKKEINGGAVQTEAISFLYKLVRIKLGICFY